MGHLACAAQRQNVPPMAKFQLPPWNSPVWRKTLISRALAHFFLTPYEKVGDSGSFLASFRLAYGILQTGLQIEVSISEQGLSLLKFLCGRSRAAFPSRRPAGDAS